MSTTLCGGKTMQECLIDPQCNYSPLGTGKCFDKGINNKQPRTITTCLDINNLAAAQQECSKTVGCRYNNTRCEEDATLKKSDCYSKYKKVEQCRKDPKCTWGERLQACFLDSSIVLPSPQIVNASTDATSCAQLPTTTCDNMFGCASDTGDPATATLCQDDPALASTNCARYNDSSNRCNTNNNCRFSYIRNTCFDTDIAAPPAGMQSCADMSIDVCRASFGCKVNGDACGNNTELSNTNCGTYGNNGVRCNADIRCRFSDARAACFDKETLQTGLFTCAHIPLDVCDKTFGCHVQQHDDGNTCEDNGHLATTAPCDRFHTNPQGCWQAGCIYHPFIKRQRRLRQPAQGGCYNSPAGHRAAGFCHLKSQEALVGFCARGNHITCSQRSIGETGNICVYMREQRESCLPIKSNGDKVCGQLEADLREAGIIDAAQLEQKCNNMQILKWGNIRQRGAPCEWNRNNNTCQARRPVRFQDGLLYKRIGNGAERYCREMMGHADQQISKKQACEDLSKVRQGHESVLDKSLCRYTAPYDSACKPNSTSADAVCIDLTQQECEGRGNSSVCEWREF
ncbi:MAG: hypothetical protein AAF310_01480 [Myxococcota bacterium]